MSESFYRLVSVLPLCDQRCRRYVIVSLVIFLLVYPFHQYFYFRLEFTQWDLLLFTGVATFIVGLRLVGIVPKRLRQTLARLSDRDVLRLNQKDQEKFFSRLEGRADLWARIIAILAAVAMLLAFIDALLKNYNIQTALLAIVAVIGAYIGGTYLGRMACYGRLGSNFLKESIDVNVDPTHLDGVGGLKPVGDYFFFQAMVVAIPAIFLAVWWFLFPIWPRDYQDWEDAYLFLFSVAMLLEILAFIVPLWSFHKIMVTKKGEWLPKADEISIRIKQLQGELGKSADGDNKKGLTEQLELLSKRYWAIENMVTWPLHTKTRRKFEFNNLLLLIPLIGDFANRTIEWEHVREFLKSFSS